MLGRGRSSAGLDQAGVDAAADARDQARERRRRMEPAQTARELAEHRADVDLESRRAGFRIGLALAELHQLDRLQRACRQRGTRVRRAQAEAVGQGTQDCADDGCRGTEEQEGLHWDSPCYHVCEIA
jgi:hypothetical protein